MKVKNIEINNFRSIKKFTFEIKSYKVILGKNNEGKSNVLKAVERFDQLIKYLSNRENRYNLDKGINIYGMHNSTISREIEKDIPLHIAKRKNSKQLTSIKITFDLNDEELMLLSQSIQLDIEFLEVNIEYNKDSIVNITIRLKDKGRKITVKRKIFLLLNYISENFEITYIPSIRTEQNSMDIVEQILGEELEELQKSDEYRKAIDTINNIQIEKLKQISDTLTPDLQKFVPKIKNIQIISDEKRILRSFRRNLDIFIDDGKKTSLSDKGDGIKSLIALSLLQSKTEKGSLILIDEPEAHLHSGAINELKEKIIENSINQQVLIASHHQLFVDRNNIENNIILSTGNQKNNLNIRDIREELGISLGENLINTECIVLVEGDSDKLLLDHIIKLTSTKLNSAMQNNKLVIESMKGVKNLQSKIYFYNSTMCKYFIVLDNDKATENQLNNLSQKGVSLVNNVFKFPLINKKEIEIEDIIKEEVIFNLVDEMFNIEDSISKNKNFAKLKLTDRLEKILENPYGKEFKKFEETFKFKLIDEILKFNNINFIKDEYIESLDELIKQIEKLWNSYSYYID